MKLLLVGHGKMGRMVEALAPEYGGEVVGVVDPMSPRHGGGPEADGWDGVDVAIDFSTADSVTTNLPALAKRGMPRRSSPGRRNSAPSCTRRITRRRRTRRPEPRCC
jgi:dihydrodipicolinate reductase